MPYNYISRLTRCDCCVIFHNRIWFWFDESNPYPWSHKLGFQIRGFPFDFYCDDETFEFYCKMCFLMLNYRLQCVYSFTDVQIFISLDKLNLVQKTSIVHSMPQFNCHIICFLLFRRIRNASNQSNSYLISALRLQYICLSFFIVIHQIRLARMHPQSMWLSLVNLHFMVEFASSEICNKPFY